jgi:hypothetical protein
MKRQAPNHYSYIYTSSMILIAAYIVAICPHLQYGGDHRNYAYVIWYYDSIPSNILNRMLLG